MPLLISSGATSFLFKLFGLLNFRKLLTTIGQPYQINPPRQGIFYNFSSYFWKYCYRL